MITDDDIDVRIIPINDDPQPYDPIVYRATLLVQSEHMINPLVTNYAKDAEGIGCRVSASLRKQILHKLYGDLRFPINELLMLARDRALAMQCPDADMKRIAKLRDMLKEVL